MDNETDEKFFVYLLLLRQTSMVATNAGRIDHTHPGPIDDSMLTLQPIHRSEVIWKGQDPGSLTCRARSEEFSNQEAMVDDRVVHIIKALVEPGPPVGAYGPPVRALLSLKWLWVPNKKNRPAHIFRDRYRQQIASMLPSQVVWQLYDAHFEDLPPWCVAGRAGWMATVPLVCFHLVELHTPDRVVRQFGMIQEIPRNVDTDTVLHAIDLRGKVGVDWMRKHALHISNGGNHLQRRCEAMLGALPPQHQYFGWFKRVTRRFIDVPSATSILMIEGYLRLLNRHPPGTEDHKDIIDVLIAVQAIGYEFPELSPIPSFDLGIGPSPPDMQQEPPSLNTPTGPSSAIDPPPVEPEQAIGLLAVPEGRPKCISKAPPCGTGGHKHGHKPGPEASDEGHARPPPRYTRQHKNFIENPYFEDPKLTKTFIFFGEGTTKITGTWGD
nr:serine/threonine-protein phosphatase 7 long form like [Quercus suber]